MEERTTLVVIGGGNMGSALVQGLLAAGHPRDGIVVCETKADRRTALRSMFPGLSVSEHVPACTEALIAVKPGDVPSACGQAVAAGATRVVSIAAGVRLDALQAACGEHVKVVRAMPNTPATVGLAATAFAPGHGCGSEEREWAKRLLSSVGLVIEVHETMLDAFTGLVGSGPAYVFYMAGALRDAAIREGFDAATSATLVARVLVGAASLLEREPEAADELRRRVTSPNGTTAAGIAEFDSRRVDEAIIAAVHAATERSRELGDA